ncbi:MAG: hypothetical protein ACJAT7_001522 [Psychromonas sp.]|jgi:hypothetical protein|uniref:DUF3450 domain-containing protein n=1 Tax=Psychromonas sp. TaxID=1884585 RepID=UPI0039E427C9
MSLNKITFILVVAVSCNFLSFTASSNSLLNAHSTEIDILEQAGTTQKKIDKSSDNALHLATAIEALESELSNLQVYQKHLQDMVSNQQQELQDIDQQLLDIEETKKGIIPLMYAMLDGLAGWVENDKPIRIKSRRERIQKLKTMIKEANISDAEKYRRILEAYQIELDYGVKLGSYNGTINSDSGARNVELLYLGRVAFVARSLDQQLFWTWNVQNKQWQAVDKEIGIDIKKAFAVANQQAAASLLVLPLSLNQEIVK